MRSNKLSPLIPITTAEGEPMLISLKSIIKVERYQGRKTVKTRLLTTSSLILAKETLEEIEHLITESFVKGAIK
jgi:hypothetical protein